MSIRTRLTSLALALALWPAACGAQPAPAGKYPDWSGQWSRIGDARWDISKPRHAQEAPLTAEYQAKLEASIADQADRRAGQRHDVEMLSARHAPHDAGL